MQFVRPLLAASLLLVPACNRGGSKVPAGCDPSIKLPEGFCATVVTDAAGRARHIAVRSNGDLFVARLGGRRDSGGITAIRGSTLERFGSSPTHGLALASDSTLYASTAGEILRFRFRGDSLAPRKAVDTIVAGLPSGAIPMHSIALDGRGGILVSIPALTAGCAQKRPCPDLATTAGIWRFDTGKRNQTLQDGHRLATGLRSPTALAVSPRDTMVYAVSHGPDSLHERFPHFDAYLAASRPADEMVRVASVRADYGWPYCYYDVIAGTRVQSPEYGGDGRAVGSCDRLIRPVMAFPAHWEPMAMVFSSGAKLPAKYKDGAFVAFHGSSHRDPLPEDGYGVAYVPFKNGIATMDFEMFADGFAGEMKSPSGARSRPAGLAQGADGSLYVSDDKGGRVWRITFTGK
jgi:glucose/arabinose dehydrogenase